MIKNERLEKWLIQIRRIIEHREIGAEKNIKKIFKELYKELLFLVSNEYLNGEEDIFKLQMDARYARFIEEVIKKASYYIPQSEEEIMDIVETAYEYVYHSTLNIFRRALRDRIELTDIPLLPREIIRQAVQNPIYGLTLSETLERYRADIIYDIKKNITIGLMNNDRYSTMAKRISETLERDYSKAIRIVRTEVHRVTEAGSYGSYDSAKIVNDELKENKSNVRLIKKWITMEDERVRKTVRANHVKMNNKVVEMDEYFDLGRGVKTLKPGSSRDAANDINCRCMVVYDIKN